MHTWAKRGLQTAVVTGGLFVIGSGIASASENVTPAAPANLPAVGNVSGVVSGLTGGETPVKAVPVAQVLDSGALSAPVKTVQNAVGNTLGATPAGGALGATPVAGTLGRITSTVNPASLTEIRGFSGNLLDTPGQMSPMDAPAAPALPGLPNLSTPKVNLPSLPAVPGGLPLNAPALPNLPVAGALRSSGGPATQAEQTLPLGPATAAPDLVAPVLAQVTKTVLSGGAAPSVSALNLPGASALLGATDVPSLPFGLGGARTQDAPALPALPRVAAPSLPAVGNLTNVGGLTNLGNLANANLPEVSSLRGELPLPGVPSTQDQPTAGLPAIPAVPGLAAVTLPNLPKTPALPAVPKLGVPSTQDAPAGLSLPNLPKVPFLPEAPALPELGGLPRVPQVTELSGLPTGAAQNAVGGFVSGLHGLPTV